MSIFNNALKGGKISNATQADTHQTAREYAMTKRHYFIGFAVIAVVVGVLIGLNVAGII